MIYIGKKGHPEPEGAYGTAPDIVHLVETKEDIDALHLTAEKNLRNQSNHYEPVGCA